MDLTLPQNLAAQGAAVDNLYYVILVLTGIAFVLVEAGIVWFVFRYRKREADYTHGNNLAEIIWTAVPAVAMVWLGVHSGQIWSELKGQRAFPEDAFTVGVTARQFEWMITYPGEDRELGTADDFTERNRLNLPVDRRAVVKLQSEDVIHSFFLPFMRVKQDAVPGMVTRTWFEPSETGEFELACAELCGLGHYRMQATVEIQEPGEFRAWYAQRAREAASQPDSSFWATAPTDAEPRPGYPDAGGHGAGEGAGAHGAGEGAGGHGADEGAGAE